MAAITAAMVKELRDKTDAGMAECKKALVEADGNIDAAVEILRKAGIAKSGKRADRVTKEGKIQTAFADGKAVMIEVLCETDFVSKNEQFAAYVAEAAGRILAGTSGSGDVTADAQKIEDENLKALFAKFGEKMVLRRAYRMESAGKISSYIHGGGRIGVMVKAEGCDNDELLKDTCMHIAVYAPAYIKPADVPAEAVAKEKEIRAASPALAGKPANLLDKIMMGQINKWYSEICLMQQPWFRDDKTCLAKLAPKMDVKEFLRWQVGEEI